MSRKERIQVQPVNMHYTGAARVWSGGWQMRTGVGLDNHGGRPRGAESCGWDGAKIKGNTGALISLFCGFYSVRCDC